MIFIFILDICTFWKKMRVSVTMSNFTIWQCRRSWRKGLFVWGKLLVDCRKKGRTTKIRRTMNWKIRTRMRMRIRIRIGIREWMMTRDKRMNWESWRVRSVEFQSLKLKSRTRVWIRIRIRMKIRVRMRFRGWQEVDSIFLKLHKNADIFQSFTEHFHYFLISYIFKMK